MGSVGCFIAATEVKKIVTQLYAHEFLVNPLQGIDFRPLDQSELAQYGVASGYQIAHIAARTLSSDSGIKVGDILCTFNGQDFGPELNRYLGDKIIGDVVTVGVLRDGICQEIQILLAVEKILMNDVILTRIGRIVGYEVLGGAFYIEFMMSSLLLNGKNYMKNPSSAIYASGYYQGSFVAHLDNNVPGKFRCQVDAINGQRVNRLEELNHASLKSLETGLLEIAFEKDTINQAGTYTFELKHLLQADVPQQKLHGYKKLPLIEQAQARGLATQGLAPQA